jgi:hypothetical protein
MIVACSRQATRPYAEDITGMDTLRMPRNGEVTSRSVQPWESPQKTGTAAARIYVLRAPSGGSPGRPRVQISTGYSIDIVTRAGCVRLTHAMLVCQHVDGCHGPDQVLIKGSELRRLSMSSVSFNLNEGCEEGSRLENGNGREIHGVCCA